MRRSRFSEEQIIAILREQEAGARMAAFTADRTLDFLPQRLGTVLQFARGLPRDAGRGEEQERIVREKAYL